LTKLLFLGCNHAQLPYLRYIKTLGFYVVGTDMNQDAPGKELCNTFYNIGYTDAKALIEAGQKENFSDRDRIFTAASQFAHAGASRFAQAFGIDYPTPPNIDLCMDKTLYYLKFKEFKIPIPATTFIENENQLQAVLKRERAENFYYLKSDFSKNPNYVYRFKGADVPLNSIFWGRDRYLKKQYVLQQEFKGIHTRLNILPDRFEIFPFNLNDTLSLSKKDIEKTGAIEKLKGFLKKLGLDNWLVKFDLVVNGLDYVVLDIGLDPPYRMIQNYRARKLNYAQYYVDHYLFKRISYPEIKF
jgi:hypothetical protein